MKCGDIDTKERVYLLTSLPDGCPAIVLHYPYAEDARKVQIVAVFASTEAGHELAETVCELKNGSNPYLERLIEAEEKTAARVQNAADSIIERASQLKPCDEGDAA